MLPAANMKISPEQAQRKISPEEAQGSQWQGREHLCLEGNLTRHLLLNIFLILVFLLNTFNRGNYWLTEVGKTDN